MNLITRKDALAEKRRYYYTGKPCLRGHVTKRLVSTRKCAGCAHAAEIRRYHRQHEHEKNRSRAYQQKRLPKPTRSRPAVCELCGGLPGKRALHLDHDHKTGKFRGWLCGGCNMILGRFGDDIAGLQRAVHYIRRNSPTDVLPTTPAERKHYPIATGVLDYFPSALVEIAHVSYVGNQQHNPGQPLHWAKEKSTDEADALLRHFKDRGTFDTDGLRHTAKVAWRALALLQREIESERTV